MARLNGANIDYAALPLRECKLRQALQGRLPFFRSAMLTTRIEHFKRLLIYALGQAIGYGIDLVIFVAAMQLFHVHSPIIAHLCGKFGSAFITYFYHARLSFPGDKALNRSASTFAYTGTIVINIIFTSLMLKFMLALFPWPAIVSKIICDVMGVFLTYMLMKTVVFTRATPQ